jgi:hypothetical protein
MHMRGYCTVVDEGIEPSSEKLVVRAEPQYMSDRGGQHSHGEVLLVGRGRYSQGSDDSEEHRTNLL